MSKKMWSRVTGPKRGKNGEIVPFFNRVYLGNELSKSKSVLIFGKLEGPSFEKVYIRFLIFPLLHPKNRGRKLGPIRDREHGLLVISSLLLQISLIFCMQLEANSGFNSVKTACPGKIWFSKKLGKPEKIVEKPILFGLHHWIEVKITIYTKWVMLSSNTTITLYIDVHFINYSWDCQTYEDGLKSSWR